MNFLIFSAALIAVAVAQYAPASPPASDGAYEPAPAPQYPQTPGGYPPVLKPYPYPDGGYDDHYRGFRKLRNLNIDSVRDARKRYFTRGGDNYVAISCPRNPVASKYVWILADSREKIPSFALEDTVVLAGGVNVEYVAKLGRHGRWEGRDLFHDEKQRFRRVGCFFGTIESGLTV